MSPGTGDGFVSGQELAARCRVSRTAIWKAVQILVRQGFRIEAVRNRGYHLSGTGEMLSGEAVTALLPQHFAGRITVYKTLDSTITEAKRICAACGAPRDAAGHLTEAGRSIHRSVVIAEQQTAGRGRLGRSFYSPAGTGVYLSILYVPEKGIIQPARMTTAAAVAVCRSLETLYGVKAGIKWVNDVFVGGKKVCGILTEGVSNFETGIIETAIVGIGVNITDGADGFPAEIAGVAGSVLGKTSSSRITRNELAAAIVRETLSIYDMEESGDGSGIAAVMREYRNRSLIIGKAVEVFPVPGRTGNAYKAVAVDVDDQARLIVQNDKGERIALQSGEITLHSGSFST